MRTALAGMLALSTLAVSCTLASGGGAGGGTSTGAATGTLRTLTESEAATTGQAQVHNALQHAESVLKFADGAVVLIDFLGRPAQPPVACDPMDIDCADGASSGDIHVDFAKAIKDVDKFLNERVFVSTQFEAGSAQEVVYHLQPATFCQTTKPSDECVQFLSQVPVRLRLTSTAVGSLNASLLIMDGKFEVARATLSDSQVSATLLLSAAPSTLPGCGGHPLGCVGKAVQTAVKILGSESDAQDFELTQSQGTVKLTYDRLTAVQGRLRMEVTSQVQVGYKFKQEPYSATVDAATVTAHVDAVSKSVDLNVQIGKFAASAPYRVVAQEFAVCGQEDEWGYCIANQKPKLGGVLQATLQGLSLSSKVVRGQKSLVLQNVGLGGAPAMLTRDGGLLASVDLNAALGHAFGATLGYVNKDQLSVAVTPGLELLVQIAASSVAGDVDFARWVRDEKVTGKLTGSAPTVLIDSDEMQVVSGDLLVASDADAKTVAAGTGQCVAVKEKGSKGAGLPSLLVPGPCGGK